MAINLGALASWFKGWPRPPSLTANPVSRIIGRGNYRKLLGAGRAALAATSMALPAGFGDDEVVLVYLYTHQELRTFNYFHINRALKGIRHPREIELLDLAQQLASALLKLPPQVGLSFRVMFMDAPTSAAHTPGAIVTYLAFTSSGMNPWAAKAGQVKMTLDGKSGRYIGDMSRFPAEKEVLFPPGRQFLVLSANPIAGTIHYVLQEV